MRKSIKFCLASLFVLAFFALSAMAQGTAIEALTRHREARREVLAALKAD